MTATTTNRPVTPTQSRLRRAMDHALESARAVRTAAATAERALYAAWQAATDAGELGLAAELQEAHRQAAHVAELAS